MDRCPSGHGGDRTGLDAGDEGCGLVDREHDRGRIPGLIGRDQRVDTVRGDGRAADESCAVERDRGEVQVGRGRIAGRVVGQSIRNACHDGDGLVDREDDGGGVSGMVCRDERVIAFGGDRGAADEIVTVESNGIEICVGGGDCLIRLVERIVGHAGDHRGGLVDDEFQGGGVARLVGRDQLIVAFGGDDGAADECVAVESDGVEVQVGDGDGAVRVVVGLVLDAGDFRVRPVDDEMDHGDVAQPVRRGDFIGPFDVELAELRPVRLDAVLDDDIGGLVDVVDIEESIEEESVVVLRVDLDVAAVDEFVVRDVVDVLVVVVIGFGVEIGNLVDVVDLDRDGLGVAQGVGRCEGELAVHGEEVAGRVQGRACFRRSRDEHVAVRPVMIVVVDGDAGVRGVEDEGEGGGETVVVDRRDDIGAIAVHAWEPDFAGPVSVVISGREHAVRGDAGDRLVGVVAGRAVHSREGDGRGGGIIGRDVDGVVGAVSALEVRVRARFVHVDVGLAVDVFDRDGHGGHVPGEVGGSEGVLAVLGEGVRVRLVPGEIRVGERRVYGDVFVEPVFDIIVDRVVGDHDHGLGLVDRELDRRGVARGIRHDEGVDAFRRNIGPAGVGYVVQLRGRTDFERGGLGDVVIGAVGDADDGGAGQVDREVVGQGVPGRVGRDDGIVAFRGDRRTAGEGDVVQRDGGEHMVIGCGDDHVFIVETFIGNAGDRRCRLVDDEGEGGFVAECVRSGHDIVAFDGIHIIVTQCIDRRQGGIAQVPVLDQDAVSGHLDMREGVPVIADPRVRGMIGICPIAQVRGTPGAVIGRVDLHVEGGRPGLDPIDMRLLDGDVAGAVGRDEIEGSVRDERVGHLIEQGRLVGRCDNRYGAERRVGDVIVFQVDGGAGFVNRETDRREVPGRVGRDDLVDALVREGGVFGPVDRDAVEEDGVLGLRLGDDFDIISDICVVQDGIRSSGTESGQSRSRAVDREMNDRGRRARCDGGHVHAGDGDDVVLDGSAQSYGSIESGSGPVDLDSVLDERAGIGRQVDPENHVAVDGRELGDRGLGIEAQGLDQTGLDGCGGHQRGTCEERGNQDRDTQQCNEGLLVTSSHVRFSFRDSGNGSSSSFRL